ncbi:MAG: ABC transporter substrate-binding protein [Deltaproteobacteria bacterium]|nr:ABC transporter substrate-binding protein [Deltaproteobacteria bacterium]
MKSKAGEKNTACKYKPFNNTGLFPVFVLLMFFSFACFSCKPRSSAKNNLRATGRTGGELRLVSLAPSLSLIVHALGADRMMAGVTADCPIIFKGKEKPVSIGRYNTMPDLETLIRLKPGLVLVPFESRPVLKHLKKLNLNYLLVKSDKLQDVIKAITLVSNAIGFKKQGEKLIQVMQSRLDRIETAVRPLDKPKVLLLIGRGDDEPSRMFAVGPGSYLDDIIKASGGRNIMANSPAAFPQISAEDVIGLKPDVIIEVVDEKRGGICKKRIIDSWRSLDTIPAVRLKRVFIFDDPRILIPGPNVVDWIDKVARVLHPEIASALN